MRLSKCGLTLSLWILVLGAGGRGTATSSEIPSTHIALPSAVDSDWGLDAAVAFEIASDGDPSPLVSVTWQTRWTGAVEDGSSVILVSIYRPGNGHPGSILGSGAVTSFHFAPTEDGIAYEATLPAGLAMEDGDGCWVAVQRVGPAVPEWCPITLRQPVSTGARFRCKAIGVDDWVPAPEVRLGRIDGGTGASHARLAMESESDLVVPTISEPGRVVLLLRGSALRHADLVLFDIAGRRLFERTGITLDPGVNELRYAPRPASGIYFLRTRLDGSSAQSTKLVIRAN